MPIFSCGSKVADVVASLVSEIWHNRGALLPPTSQTLYLCFFCTVYDQDDSAAAPQPRLYTHVVITTHRWYYTFSHHDDPDTIDHDTLCFLENDDNPDTKVRAARSSASGIHDLLRRHLTQHLEALRAPMTEGVIDLDRVFPIEDYRGVVITDYSLNA